MLVAERGYIWQSVVRELPPFFLIVLLIGGVIGAAGKDIAKGISLGLDLRGGFEILYEVKPAKKVIKLTERHL